MYSPALGGVLLALKKDRSILTIVKTVIKYSQNFRGSFWKPDFSFSYSLGFKIIMRGFSHMMTVYCIIRVGLAYH